MQNIVLSLLMNVMMAGLLLTTIIFCLRLNARIKILQDSKSELARIIQEFDESTQRDTASIAEIHTATARLSDNIQHKIDKANFIANDLEYMIEKSSKLTGKQAEASTRPARSPVASEMASKPVIEDVPGDGQPVKRPARNRSRAEEELLSMLGKKKPAEPNE